MNALARQKEVTGKLTGRSMNLNNIPVKGARALMLGITFKEIYPVKLQTSYFIENYPKNCESHFYEEYPSKCSAYFTGDCPDTSEAKSRTRFGIRNTKAIDIYPMKSRREFKRDLSRRSNARIRNHLQNYTGAIPL